MPELERLNKGGAAWQVKDKSADFNGPNGAGELPILWQYCRITFKKTRSRDLEMVLSERTDGKENHESNE